MRQCASSPTSMEFYQSRLSVHIPRYALFTELQLHPIEGYTGYIHYGSFGEVFPPSHRIQYYAPQSLVQYHG
jgi:hypothetical protein